MKQVSLRGGGRAFLFLIAALAAGVAGADVLFPTPLHLTRRIEDPFSREPIVVDEYCAGNRVVTVRGERVVIADYDRQELTEIDRGAGTYSITRFDEIANAQPAATPQAVPAQPNAPARRLGSTRAETGRTIERFELLAERLKIELGVDRAVPLRRPALDVLLGAAYPHRPSPHHEVLVAAADSSLPTEQVITHEFEGAEVTVRNVVIRVGEELAPPDLTAIPPGAVRVESRFTATQRIANDLDRH